MPRPSRSPSKHNLPLSQPSPNLNGSSHPSTKNRRRSIGTITNNLYTKSRIRLSFIPFPRIPPRSRVVLICVLGLGVTILVVVLTTIAPGDHVRIPPSPLGEQAEEAAKLSKPKIGTSGETESPKIDRSFEEPDFALLSSRQPHEIGCDVPVDWRGHKGKGPQVDMESKAAIAEKGVLVFLGVFSEASKKERRDLYRKVYWPDMDQASDLITKKFILGLPPVAEPHNPVAVVSRARVMRALYEEAEKYGDMVILDMVDNIDFGKTHKYFQWIAKTYGGEGRVKGRPRFVMKADDDTLLVMPNMMSAFRDLDCATNVYWGTSAGRSNYFGDYFRGLAYAMSWPLVSWIGNADMPAAHIEKIEDARTGQWLRHLDPITDPINRLDMGWTMGDWNQLEYSVRTVALHWLKYDNWVSEQHERILQIWRDAGIPWEWDKGIAPAKSMEEGKITPEGARIAHQQQLDLGWDVEGNVGIED